MDKPVLFSSWRNLESKGGSGSSLFLSILVLIGFIAIASKLQSFIRLLFSLFVLPGKPLSSFGPPKSWAIITGASDGIGKEFALQLARSEYSLLLISRTASKLDSLAQQIHALNPSTAIKTHAIDFAHSSSADYERLASLINGLDTAILINNVGASHDIPVPFALTASEEMEKIININCLATLRITQLVVPGMISRKRGLILTMGSFGGLIPTPLLATYSGSKAFLQHWSSALGAELAPFDITVELVQAYLITSAMSKIRRPSVMIPSARGFAKAVLARVGRTGGAQSWAYTSTPYWSHALAQWTLELVGVSSTVVVRINKVMHEGIRKRALRKREREGEKKKAL